MAEVEDLVWTDETSYSYSKPRSEQPVRIVLLDLDGTQLVVHRVFRMALKSARTCPAQSGWYVTMYEHGKTLVQDHRLAEDDDLEEAKRLALQYGIAVLSERVRRYDAIIAKLGLEAEQNEKA